MSGLLWNLYAHCYDRIAGLLPYQEMLDEVVTALAPSRGMRVLDAGCGTGALADCLAAKCPDIELVAVDQSPAMIKLARERRVWPASFKFVEGSIEDVLVGDERSYDRIASVNVIWTLPDPERTLRHMTEKLRDGGRMVHTTPSWRFRAPTIVWRHLRGYRGWGRLRAVLGLPVLALAGLLNLLLVVQSVLFARAPRAHKRWHADGLAELLRAAGTPPRTVISCYAGQNVLLVCEKEEPTGHATRLPVPGVHL